MQYCTACKIWIKSRDCDSRLCTFSNYSILVHNLPAKRLYRWCRDHCSSDEEHKWMDTAPDCFTTSSRWLAWSSVVNAAHAEQDCQVRDKSRIELLPFTLVGWGRTHHRTQNFLYKHTWNMLLYPCCILLSSFSYYYQVRTLLTTYLLYICLPFFFFLPN